MCFGLGIFDAIFGGGKSDEAKATAAAADQQAQSDRYAAQASANQMESMIAQNQATQAAAALLQTKVQPVTVSVDNPDDPNYTPASGRRRTREAFFSTATNPNAIGSGGGSNGGNGGNRNPKPKGPHYGPNNPAPGNDSNRNRFNNPFNGSSNPKGGLRL